MGLSIGIIAVKGDHLGKTDKIAEAFDYIDTSNDRSFSTWKPAAEFLFDNYADFANRHLAIRAMWFDNGWTLIFDPEMVDIVADEKIEKVSRALNADIWTFLIQTTSGSYAFSKFAPKQIRNFFMSDGQVIENNGAPLPEEEILNVNDRVYIDDIILLGKNLGIDLEPKNTTTYSVKEFRYNEKMKVDFSKFKNQARSENKRWWKFW